VRANTPYDHREKRSPSRLKTVSWRYSSALLLLFLLSIFPGCKNRSEERSLGADRAFARKTINVIPSSHQDLLKLFASHEYYWENLDEGIPPLVVKTLPEDMDQIHDLKKKKRVFFLSLLPITLLANQNIQLQRDELKDIFKKFDQNQELSPEETAFLTDMLTTYKLSGDPLEEPKLRRELLKRVDIIPPALVLAQAASESAYGTSRFSRLGNNLFGEWTFTPGTGLVPLQRPKGKTYEVRRFKSIAASVKSYLRNLNTHRAYRQLREKRAFLRSEGLPLKSLELAEGLTHYSIKGQEYIRSIKNIIRHNNLTRFSQARLRTPAHTGLRLPGLGCSS
jgi:Bax protein